MSTFKCKMCGGTLEINIGETIAVCEYCGTKQTLPKLDDEKRIQLYDRANYFRRENEFDKAMGIYEMILSEEKTDSEAYWGIVLCRYGIEYVEDPRTHKRIPTVNRAQFTSIFDDKDYISAIKYADLFQKEVYVAEAGVIDKIQKGILVISQKEEPFDIFICYKETDNFGNRTQDSVYAQDIYTSLTKEGFKVFFSRITLEDKLGSAYEPYIFAALNSAKVMLVVGTSKDNFNAVWVKNEWSRFLNLIKAGKDKTLIPVYKDISPYDMPEEFQYLQSQDIGKIGFMQDLIRGIKKIVVKESLKQVTPEVINVATGTVLPILKRVFLCLEDRDFRKADELLEQIFNLDPECAEAYIAKMMVSKKLASRDDLYSLSIDLNDEPLYVRALRFASPEYKSVLKEYRNESVYRKAASYCALNNLEKYDEAKALFTKIIDYKDSKSKCEECTVLKKLYLYNSAIETKESALNSVDIDYISKQLDSAISLFVKLGSYKDCPSQKVECEQLKVVKTYDAAKALIRNASDNITAFQKAAALFYSISKYEDSEQQAYFCEEKIEEAKNDAVYHNAMDLAKKDDLQSVYSAINKFKQISFWKDSKSQIEQCQIKAQNLEERKKVLKKEYSLKTEIQKIEKFEEEYDDVSIYGKKLKTKKTIYNVVRISFLLLIVLIILGIIFYTNSSEINSPQNSATAVNYDLMFTFVLTGGFILAFIVNTIVTTYYENSGDLLLLFIPIIGYFKWFKYGFLGIPRFFCPLNKAEKAHLKKYKSLREQSVTYGKRKRELEEELSRIKNNQLIY